MRTEKEICSSEYGKICVTKLWNVGRTENRRLFEWEIIRENTDFVVEILMDASGSQQNRQSLVALQGYIISTNSDQRSPILERTFLIGHWGNSGSTT